MSTTTRKHRSARLGSVVLMLAGTVAGTAGFIAIPIATPSAWAVNPCDGPKPPPRCDGLPDPKPDPTPEPQPTPPPTVPPVGQVASPTNLGVSQITAHSATLTWHDDTHTATAFTVTRYQQATAASSPRVDAVVVAATDGGTTFSWPQSDLQSEQTAHWSVVATAPGWTDSDAAQAGTLTVDLPDGTPALDQLSDFRRDWNSSAFPNVNKAAALADAVRIVTSPRSSIYQGQTGACGPATVEFELVARKPGRFVDYVHSLASSGSFKTADGTQYRASAQLRGSEKNTTVSEANWLFMASLKDATNAIRITGSTGPKDSAWISSPADVDNWLSHLVGLHKTTAEAILRPFSTGEKVMPRAASVLRAGGAVVLLVDSSLVGNPAETFSSPNHYVNLLNWSSTRKNVSFTVATWGGTTKIDTSWSRFNGLTWDVLTAK